MATCLTFGGYRNNNGAAPLPSPLWGGAGEGQRRRLTSERRRCPVQAPKSRSKICRPPPARLPPRRPRPRHEDHRHRPLRPGATHRHALPHHPPHQIRQGRRRASETLRPRKSRRPDPRPADQHEQHGGSARPGDARIPAQPRAPYRHPCRALGRAPVDRRRRARHARGRPVAQEARRKNRRRRRGLHPAGRARPAGAPSRATRGTSGAQKSPPKSPPASAPTSP